MEDIKQCKSCTGCSCGQDDESSKHFSALKKIVKEVQSRDGTILMALQSCQVIFGYLDRISMDYIAKQFKSTTTELYSIASFYSQFKFEKQGKYRISLCLGTACYVRGANLVQDKIQDFLKIKLGETTSDGKFTFDGARCVGCCGLAPVMLINEEVFPVVSAATIEGILKKFE